jgi:hypothetical protein
MLAHCCWTWKAQRTTGADAVRTALQTCAEQRPPTPRSPPPGGKRPAVPRAKAKPWDHASCTENDGGRTTRACGGAVAFAVAFAVASLLPPSHCRRSPKSDGARATASGAMRAQRARRSPVLSGRGELRQTPTEGHHAPPRQHMLGNQAQLDRLLRWRRGGP